MQIDFQHPALFDKQWNIITEASAERTPSQINTSIRLAEQSIS